MISPNLSNIVLPLDADRFKIELEFVQNLSNPRYLHYLAQNGYFQNQNFMEFLKYLRYWQRPEYLQHITFPHCIAFLNAVIENEEFRKEISMPQFMEFVYEQQGLQWLSSEKRL
eukprot:gene7580-10328_t